MPRSLQLQKFNRHFLANSVRIEKDTRKMNRFIKFLIGSIINKINHISSSRKKFPTMDKESILYLKKFYSEEVSNLEKLLNKKLIYWKYFYS